MISKELLSKGYDAGLVRIVDSPMGDGAVCAIGENWFYFGGLTAEQHSAAEYVKAVPKEDILNEIFMVLEDFRREAGDFGDEYMYYDSYLREKFPDRKVDSPLGKRFMLISVYDRDISTARFETIEEARAAMYEEIAQCGGEDIPNGVFNKPMYEAEDFGFGMWSGFVNNGKENEDYDWLIVDLGA